MSPKLGNTEEADNHINNKKKNNNNNNNNATTTITVTYKTNNFDIN